jgi:hypothetical protein
MRLKRSVKREVRPVFEILEWKIGGGYYVKMTMPNAATENIEGFKTEAKAAQWIRNESAAWLVSRCQQVANSH